MKKAITQLDISYEHTSLHDNVLYGMASLLDQLQLQRQQHVYKLIVVQKRQPLPI